MALFRSLFEWVQCFVHRIPRRRKKQGVPKWTEAEWTPVEGVSRPLDVSNIDQKYQTRYCKASKYLNDKGKEREEKREVGRKRWFKKGRKMVDERESGRKEEENKDPTPLRIEVKPQPTPPAAEVKTPASSSFIKSSVKEPLVDKRASRLLPPLATKTRPPSSGEEPMLVQTVSQHPALPAIKVNPLPGSSFIKSSEEEPPLSVANFAPKATETKPLRGSFVVDPEVVQKASRQLTQPATESLAVPRELTPKQVISMSSSTSSKSPEDEPQMVQRASRNLFPPAIKNIPLQSVAKLSMLQRTSRHFAPKPTESKPLRGSFVLQPKMIQSASRHVAPAAEEPSVAELLVVQHKPTESLSHSMEEQLMEQVMHPSRQIPKCAEMKPKSATSSLILMDIESEEDESVEHSERTIPSSGSETNHEQTLEAGVKQKAMFEKVHPIVLEQSNDSEKKKCGDSKADAVRKAKELDERMMRLFCVDYNPCPKKEKQQPSRKGQKKPKNKGKTTAGPFSWTEKKLKRINEEKEESEKDENTGKGFLEKFLRDPISEFNTQPYL